MSFLKLLDLFNRKERYHLLANALKDPFQIGEKFATKLADSIGMDVPLDAWVAMDYHLDWIAVAVKLHQENCSLTHDKKLSNPCGELFEANQQDIDLVVAFENDKVTHLILIEAKAYEQKWLSRQLCRKLIRLQDIFEQPQEDIRPHFVLTSPTPGAKLIRKTVGRRAGSHY